MSQYVALRHSAHSQCSADITSIQLREGHCTYLSGKADSTKGGDQSTSKRGINLPPMWDLQQAPSDGAWASRWPPQLSAIPAMPPQWSHGFAFLLLLRGLRVVSGGCLANLTWPRGLESMWNAEYCESRTYSWCFLEENVPGPWVLYVAVNTLEDFGTWNLQHLSVMFCRTAHHAFLSCFSPGHSPCFKINRKAYWVVVNPGVPCVAQTLVTLLSTLA